jgi:hypothetical protein
MSARAYHDSKNSLSTEGAKAAPPCTECGDVMSVVGVESRITAEGIYRSRELECSECGARRTILTATPWQPETPSQSEH